MSYPPREGSRDTRQGLVISKYPDVCRSPNACVPYTIVAYQSDDAGTAATVRMTGQRAHKQNSIITKCYGDEPGVGLGVKSNTVGSVCHRKTHSKTVRIEGQWATRDTDEWYMNNRNTIGKLAWSSNAPSHAPTPPLQETPVASSDNQQGQVMSDAAPMTFEPGKEYAFNDTPWSPSGSSTSTTTQSPQTTSSPPASTETPDNTTPPSWSRWWRWVTGFAETNPATTGAGAGTIVFGGLTGGTALVGTSRANALADDAARASLGLPPRTRTPFMGLAVEPQLTLPPQPIGRTPDNVSVKGEKKKRECRCITGAYDEIKNVCGVACGAGYQAHHIVPDYTLRYGTRAEAEKNQKRIPGLPTFGQGPAICLKGYAADAGSEHGLAHQADVKVNALGSGWSTPQGTADISSITEISRDAAVAATKGECETEIAKALAAQPSLRSNILGRTTIMPPAEGTKPYELLSNGARATVH